MQVLDNAKAKISQLSGCHAAYLLAHAAWSACDHRELPGPSCLETSSTLDASNKELLFSLQQISCLPDYSNSDQAAMLRWLHEQGYSSYIAKKVKTTKAKLVDWL